MPLGLSLQQRVFGFSLPVYMEVSKETKREGQIMTSETKHTHFSQGEIPAELLVEVCPVGMMQKQANSAKKPRDAM